MRRIISGALLLFALAACGGNDDDAATPATTEAPSTTTTTAAPTTTTTTIDLDTAPVAASDPAGLAAQIEAAEADGFVLTPSGRYAHGDGYVRATATAAGFDLALTETTALRTEDGKPVAGRLYAFRKSS